MTAEAQLAAWARSACLLEATAPKAGNVHPGAAFDDADWLDFAVSADAAAEPLARAGRAGVGAAVLAAVEATRRATGTNTNLGLLLLLAPLCAAAGRGAVRAELPGALGGLEAADGERVYEAIRLASPGGLGSDGEADVRGPAPEDLIAAMRRAAGRDLIARQYANGFADVLERLEPALAADLADGAALDDAIVGLHLRQLAHEPDTLIRRKHGEGRAWAATRAARAVVEAGGRATPLGNRLFARLDADLRAGPEPANPGASADLVGAALFAGLARGRVPGPPWPWREPLGTAARTGGR